MFKIVHIKTAVANAVSQIIAQENAHMLSSQRSVSDVKLAIMYWAAHYVLITLVLNVSKQVFCNLP